MIQAHSFMKQISRISHLGTYMGNIFIIPISTRLYTIGPILHRTHPNGPITLRYYNWP